MPTETKKLDKTCLVSSGRKMGHAQPVVPNWDGNLISGANLGWGDHREDYWSKFPAQM